MNIFKLALVIFATIAIIILTLAFNTAMFDDINHSSSIFVLTGILISVASVLGAICILYYIWKFYLKTINSKNK